MRVAIGRTLTGLWGALLLAGFFVPGSAAQESTPQAPNPQVTAKPADEEAGAPGVAEALGDESRPAPLPPAGPLWGYPVPSSPSPLLAPLTTEQTEIFPFVPPLNIDQSVELLRRVRAQLKTAESETPPSDVRMKQITGAIQASLSLTRQVDRRLVSLDQYEWYSIGTRKVSPGAWSELAFEPELRIEGVMALAFRSEGGRVLVEDVAVDPGGAGDALHPPCGTIYLREDVPKREICQLLEPVPLRSLRIRAATDELLRASLQVYVGISPVEEFGKRAWQQLEIALREVGRYEFESARNALESAESALWDFKWYHNL